MKTLVLYLISSIIVVWSMRSININNIFKKNKESEARMFYFILALCLIELLTSLLKNIFEMVNFF